MLNGNLIQGSDINQKVRFNAVLDLIFNDGTVTEPILLADIKSYAKIDTGTADDTIIQYLITTARQQCEDFTGISIVPRTVTAVINNTCGGMFLPYCPFKTLVSITDDDGVAVVPLDYKISGTTFPQLIYPKWDRLTLVYTTGYVILPQEIKTQFCSKHFISMKTGERML